MPITWRNVDAPDLRASIAGVGQAANTIGSGLDKLSALGGQQRQLNIQAGEQDQLNKLNQARAAILGAETSQDIGEIDLTSLGQQYGLDPNRVAQAQNLFNQQRDAVQADELAAATEARKVAKEARDVTLHKLDVTGRTLGLQGDKADINTKLRNAATNEYLDASSGTINSLIAKGGNQQAIDQMLLGLEAEAPNAEAASKLRPLIQAQIAKRDALSPEQQRQHSYLVNSIDNQANAAVATAETQLASAQSQFPVSPTYGIMAEMEKGADWVGYINKNAPAGGWFGGSRGDAAGSSAKQMIQRDIKTLTNDKELKNTLVESGLLQKGESFNIPNEVVMYTLQQQIVDPDDKQVDLSTFRDELASNLQEYLRGRYNQGELGKAQSAYNKAIATIAKDKNNRMAKSFDIVKKNKLFNQ